MTGRRILLLIGGGIAAYKTLELIRRLRERGCSVRVVMTAAAREFVTPLSVAALSGERVYEALFSLTDEAEMGHIRLSREADLLVVVPATADLLAKMAQGHADDLASTVLLATDKPVLVAPAMNPLMWNHAATRRNVATLRQDGIGFIGPEEGDMACGEVGAGRMAEPAMILAAIEHRLLLASPPAAASGMAGPLAGRRALVTSGPTHEPIDPVRYIANRSSGRQGHAIAAALRDAGALVTLVTGPVALPDPPGVTVRHIGTAEEMLAACLDALPCDIAVCAAAVADWRVEAPPAQKLKKGAGPPSLRLTLNPDVLEALARHAEQRPPLVVGFAAETDDLVAQARTKLARKGCDWILANDVGGGVFGGADNEIVMLRRDAPLPEPWPRLTKEAVAQRLVRQIVGFFDDAARHAVDGIVP